MRTSTFVWIIILILAVLGIAWYFYAAAPASVQTSNTATSTNETTSSSNPPTGGATGSTTGSGSTGSSSAAGSAAGKTVTITLTSSGFSPSTVTVAKGDTVKWVNQGSGSMNVASNEHPTHTQFDGSSRSSHCASSYTGAKPFDECSPGNTYSFTFTKAGTFDYHNHANASQTGKVVVQ